MSCLAGRVIVMGDNQKTEETQPG